MADISPTYKTITRGYMSQALYFGSTSRAHNGYAVVQGGQVKQRAAGANMSVDFDEVDFVLAGRLKNLAAGNQSIDAADPTNPRMDIVYLNSSGAMAISKGTAAVIKPVGETTWQEYEEPYPADLKAVVGVPLALVHIGAGVTTITDTNILMIAELTDTNINGWIPARTTWTYGSASDEFFTFTISGADWTDIYKEGTRIKLTQTTVKYFRVVSSTFSTNTTVTIYGGGLYTLANATISSPWISRDYAPAGMDIALIEDCWIPLNIGATYASADDPNFTFTLSGNWTAKIPLSSRIKLYQSSTIAYYLVVKTSYSDPNTTITVFGGTDYNLANATISSPCYSIVFAPKGFPMSVSKWTYTITDTDDAKEEAPTTGTWYNVGSKSYAFPIGSWYVKWWSNIEGAKATSGYLRVFEQLNTAANGTGTSYCETEVWTNNTEIGVNDRNRCTVVPYEFDAKTTLYLIMKIVATDPDYIYSYDRKFQLVSAFFR